MSTFARPFVQLASVGALAALAGTSAWAQSAPLAQGLLDNSFVANLGAFIVSTDIKASLNGQSTTNPEIDFDESFGRVNDANRVRGDVLWRINPKHHLRFLYFDNSNTRSKSITEDVKWGDLTFQAGTTLEATNKFEVIELAYEYAFMRAPTYEVAASLGVHYTDISVRLSGTAFVTDADGVQSSASFSSKQGNLPAPLPVIGLRAGWVVAPDWYLDAQAQYFGYNAGEYDGSWTDMRLGATWMFSRNFGVGLGWNRFATKLDVTRDSFNGRLKFGYSGLQAYLTGTF
jgi:hypothetical protein